jgi:hypothetical protein
MAEQTLILDLKKYDEGISLYDEDNSVPKFLKMTAWTRPQICNEDDSIPDFLTRPRNARTGSEDYALSKGIAAIAEDTVKDTLAKLYSSGAKRWQ